MVRLFVAAKQHASFVGAARQNIISSTKDMVFAHGDNLIQNSLIWWNHGSFHILPRPPIGRMSPFYLGGTNDNPPTNILSFPQGRLAITYFAMEAYLPNIGLYNITPEN